MWEATLDHSQLQIHGECGVTARLEPSEATYFQTLSSWSSTTYTGAGPEPTAVNMVDIRDKFDRRSQEQICNWMRRIRGRLQALELEAEP